MELVRGSISDRPWGLTLGALARRHLTGQLAIVVDDKPYRVAFDRGMIVGATSPLAVDSIARIALTNHLVGPTQVPAITRALAAHPDRDELAVLAGVVPLPADRLAVLQRRVLMQRAARTFALDHGDFVVDNAITIPRASDCVVDARAVIYLGIRMNLSEQRLADDLRTFGAHFKLLPEATDQLARFEFTEAEQPILDALRTGTNLPELELANHELGQRSVQAVVSALFVCAALEATNPTAPSQPVSRPKTIPPRTVSEPVVNVTPRMRMSTIRPAEEVVAPEEVVVFRSPASRISSPSIPVPSRTPTANPRPARTQTPEPRAPRTPTPFEPRPSRTPTPVAPRASRTSTPNLARTTTPVVRPTDPRSRALVSAGIELLERGVDYFTLLGLEPEAPVEAVRSAYLDLARHLHPDRLSDFSMEERKRADRLFAQINFAYGLLSDPQRRADYIRGKHAVAAPEPTDPKAIAQAAYGRGEMALRRDQVAQAVVEFTAALESNPDHLDAQTMIAWSRFCASSDKAAVAAPTRAALEKCIRKSEEPVLALLYLGRVERMLGRDKEAMRHFNELLLLKPRHAEAQSELRVIEARLAADPGLFGRKR